jgi:hypothetical protein
MYFKTVKEHHLLVTGYGAMEFYVMTDGDIVAKTGDHMFDEKNMESVMAEGGFPEEFVAEVKECIIALKTVKTTQLFGTGKKLAILS